jgi:PTH2 family peptidyl-tRNA hydrolase
MSEPKQIIVMRTDLNMRKGKMIAQGAHASLKVLLDNDDKCKTMDWLARGAWLDGSFTKVCVRVGSEEELLEIRDTAIASGLHVALITDAGRTEFNGVPTNTCIAIGPEFPEDLIGVTDHLKLL